MDQADHSSKQVTLTDYLAVERTILAWIRTGLALMGFGFVVARFGIFLEQFQGAEHVRPMRPQGFAIWTGIALIGTGVFVNLAAGLHHLRLLGQLDRGAVSESHRSPQATAIIVLLALAGLSMMIYLIANRHLV